MGKLVGEMELRVGGEHLIGFGCGEEDWGYTISADLLEICSSFLFCFCALLLFLHPSLVTSSSVVRSVWALAASVAGWTLGIATTVAVTDLWSIATGMAIAASATVVVVVVPSIFLR